MSSKEEKGWRKFNLATIEDDAVVLVIGGRGSGKTTLVLDILYHKRYLPFGTCFAGSVGSYREFVKKIPPLFIHKKFDEDVLRNFMTRMEKMVRKCGELGVGPVNAFLICDDIGYDKKSWRKEIVREVFMNGRHFKILMIVTLQYCMDLLPELRSNADYIFVFRDEVISNQLKLYEHFGVFPDKNSFLKAYYCCTQGKKCCVINKKIRSDNITDKFMYYEAPYPAKDFLVGSDLFWNFHDKRYITDDEMDQLQNGTINHQQKSEKNETIEQEDNFDGRSVNIPSVLIEN